MNCFCAKDSLQLNEREAVNVRLSLETGCLEPQELFPGLESQGMS